jgi:uncharacterized protein with HEPN domain
MSLESSIKDIGRVVDIWNAGRLIVQFMNAVTYEQFIDNEEKQSAVIHKITLMGEATKKLSDAFKELHNNIPWYQISGMRNRLIHDYDDIDLGVVWEVATQDVPSMIEYLSPLIPNDI